MVFEGEETFAYDITDVWNALHDTNVLTKAIPGCKSMSAVGNNSYVVALSLGVAAVRGEYEGKVKVTDVKSLSHYNIEGEGKGAPGFVKLRMDCWFERAGMSTSMKWRCDAAVGGLIASIGGKVLSGISKFMAQQFFNAFRDELSKFASPTGDGSLQPASSSATAARVASTAIDSAPGNWLARIWTSLYRRFFRQRAD
jgi:carbon monoxide dehydrogenase subunit G